jgi:phosphatidylglycerol:prolipoprotein diacylglycerol transferase
MVRPVQPERFAVPFPDISPIAFEIGPLAVRWYALGYLFGVLIGAAYAVSLLKRPSLWAEGRPPFPAPDAWDFAFWAIIGIVVGGRTGYVLFYNLPLYLAHPLQVFELWDGGMSFHGGLIGIMIAVAIFTRSRGGNILSAFDLLSACAPFGIYFVRCANFINGELYGRVTDLPWGVIFPGAGPLPRHPSQLYEAGLEGVAMFIIIRLVTHVFYGLRRPGLAAGVFGVWYAISRILLEFVRLPDPQLGYLFFGWVTMGQILSLPLLVIGLGLIAYAMRKRPRV